MECGDPPFTEMVMNMRKYLQQTFAALGLLLLLLPNASQALGCWLNQSGGPLSTTLTLPSNVYISSTAPTGTVIWQSPLQSISVYCTQSVGENVYFWVNPNNRTLAAGVQIGIIFNGVTYTQTSGAINTGIYVPQGGQVTSNLQYSIVILKSSNSPSSGVVNINSYPVFQLDGKGGLNNVPINLNQLLNGSVTFTPGGTCALSAADVNRSITLPNASTFNFPGVGSTFGRTYFTITASNCSTGVRTATFRFTGTPDGNVPTAFANSGTAKGVAINMASASDGLNIGANVTNNSRVVNVQSQMAQLPAYVEYYRTTTMVPGTVQSIVSVTMLYQ